LIQIKERLTRRHIPRPAGEARSRCGGNATPKDFSEDCGEPPQLSPISCATSAWRAREMHKATIVRGCVMRDYSKLGIPDTAPYKEWLGVVGSMLVAALVGIVLYSGAFLT
jgi:hypothetical protein